jgi:hypothetical protein
MIGTARLIFAYDLQAKVRELILCNQLHKRANPQAASKPFAQMLGPHHLRQENSKAEIQRRISAAGKAPKDRYRLSLFPPGSFAE